MVNLSVCYIYSSTSWKIHFIIIIIFSYIFITLGNKDPKHIIIIIIIIIIILNPRKNEGGKKIKKSRKRFEVEN